MFFFGEHFIIIFVWRVTCTLRMNLSKIYINIIIICLKIVSVLMSASPRVVLFVIFNLITIIFDLNVVRSVSEVYIYSSQPTLSNQN